MNNVWTAIAFRAPCVARYATATPRRPILQLFNGYSRLKSRSHKQGDSISQRVHCFGYGEERRRSYSTSAVLQASKNRKAKQKIKYKKVATTRVNSNSNATRSETHSDPTLKNTPPPSESPVEAAPTEASYTEGLPEEEATLTWRDYDPEGGMPLPDGELSHEQLNRIFVGNKLDEETGNYILNVLYWRRQSGALIDVGLSFPDGSGVTREQALHGLMYVRSLDPDFDEQAAGRTWAEEESLRLQEELQERAVKLRLYKRDGEPEPEPEPELVEQSDQGTQYGRERNQDSSLVRLRKENEALAAAEEAERQIQEEQKQNSALARHRGPLQLSGGVQPPTETQLLPTGGLSITTPNQKAWLQPVERKDWVKRYEKHAEIIKDHTIPTLSTLQRLGPSFILLCLILAGCIYLSDNYTPPSTSARLFPDWAPTTTTLATLTALLTTTFLLARLPPLWRFYSKHMTIIPAYPFATGLIGATLRHDTLKHLLTNLASLWLFGMYLHEDVGRGSFLAIYIAAGALGGFSSLAYHVFHKNWTTYIFGSSNCVLGVMAALCVCRPMAKIRLWGEYELPIAPWVFLALFGGGEVIAIRVNKLANIDHVGHVGGMIGGLAGAAWIRMRTGRTDNVGDEGAVIDVMAGEGWNRKDAS